MRGNLVPIDYELSSWRHMDDDAYVPSKYAKYICGLEPVPPGCELVIKRGYVMRDDGCRMGMGSAYGGKWKPRKEEDKRFLGKPGEIKETRMPNGDLYATKIGEDGRAVRERHYTDHRRPDKHSDPHDHEIHWDNQNGFSKPQRPINYQKDIPEFKYVRRKEMMETVYKKENSEENRFETISDFKWCVDYGGEVEFEWKGTLYTITHPEGMINISEAWKPETEKWCATADEALEYMIDGVRLREIITQVEVKARTI